MAIFETFTWTVRPQYLPQHETIIDKYNYILKLLKSKISGLVSYRYFSTMYGSDTSPLGGRMLILEYESMKAYEEFQETLFKREDFQGFQQSWGSIIFSDSLRSSLLHDRNRESWFDGKEKEIVNV